MLSLAVAQRYSVLVTALDDASANYAIHANMDTDMFDTIPDNLNPSKTQSRILYNTKLIINKLQRCNISDRILQLVLAH